MQNRQKLEKLLERSEELDKKIQRDSEKKATLKKQIEAVKAQEIITFMNEHDIPFGEELFSIMNVVNTALSKGLTAAEIERLLGLNPITKMEDNTNEKKVD